MLRATTCNYDQKDWQTLMGGSTGNKMTAWVWAQIRRRLPTRPEIPRRGSRTILYFALIIAIVVVMLYLSAGRTVRRDSVVDFRVEKWVEFHHNYNESTTVGILDSQQRAHCYYLILNKFLIHLSGAKRTAKTTEKEQFSYMRLT